MTSPLSGSLAKTIDKAFKASGLPLAGVLYRRVQSGVNEYNDPLYTLTTYTCRGYVDSYSDVRRAQAGIPQGDRLCAVFGNSISVVPQIDDVVKFPGYDYLQLRDVSTDPAKALYECQSYTVDEPQAVA